MLDNFSFFESGYIIYSVSFVFAGTSGSTPLNASMLLALESLAGGAGEFEHASKTQRDEVLFGWTGGGGKKPLNEFLRERFQDLKRTHLAFQAPPSGKHALRTCSIFSLFGNNDPGSDGDRGELLKSLLNFEFREINSIGIEIIGARRHTDVLEYAAASDRRVAAVDSFSKRLAGIVQNIIDFVEQDREEIHDSLGRSMKIGTDITFGHQHIMTRFSESSRSYEKMRNVIGGSVYWMLVQVVMAHNGALLGKLHQELDNLCEKRGLAGMMNVLLYRHDKEKWLKNTRLRRDRLAHYIPNLFRYETEQRLYDMISKTRGVEATNAYFVRLEEEIEKAEQDITSLNSEVSNSRITKILIAIGLFQVAGAFAGIASGVEGYVRTLGVTDNLAKQVSPFWALVLAIAFVLFGALLLLFQLVSDIRRWIRLWLLGKERRWRW